MPVLFLSILGCVAIHLLTIAATAHVVGVRVRAVSLGVGPVLARFGRFQLRAVPLGGHVALLDSRIEPVPKEAMPQAFDGRSTAEQVAIALSGCAALVAVAWGLLWTAGLEAVGAGVVQILRGAVSPFGHGQGLVADVVHFARTASATVVFGCTAAKLAALNLLPLPALNGGAALTSVGRRLGFARWWPAWANTVLSLGALGIGASWCAAVVACAVRS
jgi:membrane-associated protease RseP (regulator of RpoE activity)